jgi:hypothetical protein
VDWGAKNILSSTAAATFDIVSEMLGERVPYEGQEPVNFLHYMKGSVRVIVHSTSTRCTLTAHALRTRCALAALSGTSTSHTWTAVAAGWASV